MVAGYLTIHIEEEKQVGIMFVSPDCSLAEVRVQINKQEVAGLSGNHVFLWTAAKAQLSSAQEALIKVASEQEEIHVRLLADPASSSAGKRDADREALQEVERSSKTLKQADGTAASPIDIVQEGGIDVAGPSRTEEEPDVAEEPPTKQSVPVFNGQNTMAQLQEKLEAVVDKEHVKWLQLSAQTMVHCGACNTYFNAIRSAIDEHLSSEGHTECSSSSMEGQAVAPQRVPAFVCLKSDGALQSARVGAGVRELLLKKNAAGAALALASVAGVDCLCCQANLKICPLKDTNDRAAFRNTQLHCASLAHQNAAKKLSGTGLDSKKQESIRKELEELYGDSCDLQADGKQVRCVPCGEFLTLGRGGIRVLWASTWITSTGGK